MALRQLPDCGIAQPAKQSGFSIKKKISKNTMNGWGNAEGGAG
jgi:hypothetical protein